LATAENLIKKYQSYKLTTFWKWKSETIMMSLH